MLGAMPHDENFPPEDPDDVDPHHFHFFGFGQPGQGPPPGNNGPFATNLFHADAADPSWAPWNPNAAQGNALNQPAPQIAAEVELGPLPEKVPLLIPIQQVEQPVHEGQVADENDLPLPVEQVIQNIPEMQEAPQLAEEQVLAKDDDTVNDHIQLGFVQVQNSWPQKNVFGPYPAMLHKSAPCSGFEYGQSSKQPLPVDPFQGLFSSQNFSRFLVTSNLWMHA
jgi:hypothetical protein